MRSGHTPNAQAKLAKAAQAQADAEERYERLRERSAVLKVKAEAKKERLKARAEAKAAPPRQSPPPTPGPKPSPGPAVPRGRPKVRGPYKTRAKALPDLEDLLRIIESAPGITDQGLATELGCSVSDVWTLRRSAGVPTMTQRLDGIVMDYGPGASTKELREELARLGVKVSKQAVRIRRRRARRALQDPSVRGVVRTRRRLALERAVVEEVAQHPGASDAEIARALGSMEHTVQAARGRLGIAGAHRRIRALIKEIGPYKSPGALVEALAERGVVISTTSAWKRARRTR